MLRIPVKSSDSRNMSMPHANDAAEHVSSAQKPWSNPVDMIRTAQSERMAISAVVRRDLAAEGIDAAVIDAASSSHQPGS